MARNSRHRWLATNWSSPISFPELLLQWKWGKWIWYFHANRLTCTRESSPTRDQRWRANDLTPKYRQSHQRPVLIKHLTQLDGPKFTLSMTRSHCKLKLTNELPRTATPMKNGGSESGTVTPIDWPVHERAVQPEISAYEQMIHNLRTSVQPETSVDATKHLI